MAFRRLVTAGVVGLTKWKCTPTPRLRRPHEDIYGFNSLKTFSKLVSTSTVIPMASAQSIPAERLALLDRAWTDAAQLYLEYVLTFYKQSRSPQKPAGATLNLRGRRVLTAFAAAAPHARNRVLPSRSCLLSAL